MNDPAARLVQDRVTREAALAAFTANLTQVKNDLEARGIGGRIADHASGQVRDAANQAVAVAKESKGIIAGTFAALGLWTFRKPLLAAAQRLFGDQAEVQAEPLEDSETSGEPSSD